MMGAGREVLRLSRLVSEDVLAVRLSEAIPASDGKCVPGAFGSGKLIEGDD